MRVLITSGGTTEKIDNVRGISNFATGRLGRQIAETFLAAGHEVILLAAGRAILPKKTADLSLVPISDVADLQEEMAHWVPQVDVVIHSMAVSDYHPLYMTGLEKLPEHLAKDELINFQVDKEKKIASKSDYQIMVLKKTPKVLAQVKKWNSQVILFAFKLLVGVPEAELIATAEKSKKDNQADFVLANDLENISASKHQAFLIGGKQMQTLQTNKEIAAAILQQAEATVTTKEEKHD